MKKIYMKPEIFVAKIKVECVLNGQSLTLVNPEGGQKADKNATIRMESKGRGDYEDESSFGDLW